MNKYFTTQIEIFKKSFRMKKFSLNLFIELAKYLVLILILAVGLAIILKAIYAVMPLLNSAEKIHGIPKESVPKEMLLKIIDQKVLLNNLFITTAITILFMILSSSFVIAYFNLLISCNIHNEKLSFKRLLNLCSIYFILGVILTGIFVLVLLNSYNLLTILFTLILLLSLRIYFYSTYLVSVKGKNFIEDLKHGLLYKIKFYRTIVPIFIGLIVFILFFSIIIKSIDLISTYMLIPLILLIASWNIWMKSYNAKVHDHYHKIK